MISPRRMIIEDSGLRARDNLRHEEFVRRVQFRCGLLTGGAAELAVKATLRALGERLLAEDDEVASELTSELSSLSFRQTGFDLLAELEAAKGVVDEEFSLTEFSLTGFFERVGAATGVGLAEAERHACVVAYTLEEAAHVGELDGIRSRLPDEYEFLFVY